MSNSFDFFEKRQPTAKFGEGGDCSFTKKSDNTSYDNVIKPTYEEEQNEEDIEENKEIFINNNNNKRNTSIKITEK